MKISEAQIKVDKQIMNYGGYWRLGSMFLRLIEEVGELARAINIKYGDKKAKTSDEGKNLESEVADMFYTTLALSNYYKIDFKENIPNHLEVDTRDDINVVQDKLKSSEEIDKLLILPKLIRRIGDFSELVLISDNNIEINYNIANMILTVIQVADELNIDLTEEFNKKVGEDESKMSQVYGNN